MSAPAFASGRQRRGQRRRRVEGRPARRDRHGDRRGDQPPVHRGDVGSRRVSPRRPCGRPLRIAAELAGFAPTAIENVELLVGQNADDVLHAQARDVNESVTVTGEAPLVDTAQARVAGNVDRRQMEQLPISGRNWQQLAMMVKGITANTINSQPGVTRDSAFSAQPGRPADHAEHVLLRSFGQPGISRDAIAEFQIVTNLFDVTMGRSRHPGPGHLALGHEQLRRQLLRLLPRRQAQREGRVRQPRAALLELADRRHVRRTDRQGQGPVLRLVRGRARAEHADPGAGGAARADLLDADAEADSQRAWRVRLSDRVARSPDRAIRLLAIVSSDRAVGAPQPRQQPAARLELHVHQLVARRAAAACCTRSSSITSTITGCSSRPPARRSIPEYIFPGLTLGPNWNYPEDWNEDFVTTRYDLTWHKGSHDLKIGAELRVGGDRGWWMARSRGQMRFSALPADASARFPADAATDPSRWDFSGLDPLGLRYDIYYAQTGGGIDGRGNWSFDMPRPTVAGWIGDTWRMNNRLTRTSASATTSAGRICRRPG